VPPGEDLTEKDLVQIADINNPPERQVVVHVKPY
jgi:hypothetical protein